MKSKPLHSYYYILIQKNAQGDGEFVLMDNSVSIEIEGWKDYDFFIVHSKDGKYKSFWIMSEGRTGLKMFEGQTRQHLLQNVRYGLRDMTKKHLDDLIKYYINQYGISPRYKTIKQSDKK